MDLTYTPEELAFQREVRAWLKRSVPKRQRDDRPIEFGDPRRIAEAKAWQRKVYEAGYLALAWPREYGGQGADIMRQTIVNEEMVRARAPGLIGLLGISMVGPTLIQHGSEEQRRRHLPTILTAEEIWCQGYSEPGAGSDLASLRTRAELRGDAFVVNGQVANATLAHERSMLGSTMRTQQTFQKLVRLARTQRRNGGPASKDPVIRQRLADLAIRVETMKLEAYRQLTEALRKRPPGISA